MSKWLKSVILQGKIQPLASFHIWGSSQTQNAIESLRLLQEGSWNIMAKVQHSDFSPSPTKALWSLFKTTINWRKGISFERCWIQDLWWILIPKTCLTAIFLLELRRKSVPSGLGPSLSHSEFIRFMGSLKDHFPGINRIIEMDSWQNSHSALLNHKLKAVKVEYDYWKPLNCISNSWKIVK